MIDERERFERTAARFEPPTDAFDRFVDRRRRVQRNRRITAGVIALLIAAAAAGSLGYEIRSAPPVVQPAPPGVGIFEPMRGWIALCGSTRSVRIAPASLRGGPNGCGATGPSADRGRSRRSDRLVSERRSVADVRRSCDRRRWVDCDDHSSERIPAGVVLTGWLDGRVPGPRWLVGFRHGRRDGQAFGHRASRCRWLLLARVVPNGVGDRLHRDGEAGDHLGPKSGRNRSSCDRPAARPCRRARAVGVVARRLDVGVRTEPDVLRHRADRDLDSERRRLRSAPDHTERWQLGPDLVARRSTDRVRSGPARVHRRARRHRSAARVGRPRVRLLHRVEPRAVFELARRGHGVDGVREADHGRPAARLVARRWEAKADGRVCGARPAMHVDPQRVERRASTRRRARARPSGRTDRAGRARRRTTDGRRSPSARRRRRTP